MYRFCANDAYIKHLVSYMIQNEVFAYFFFEKISAKFKGPYHVYIYLRLVCNECPNTISLVLGK